MSSDEAPSVRPQPDDAGGGPSTGDGRAGDGETIEVVNPATGETVADVPALGAPAVGDLVARAREAQPHWERVGFEGRRRVLARLRRRVLAEDERIIDLLQREGGKTHEEAMVEVTFLAMSLGFWPEHGPELLADRTARSWSPLTFGRRNIVTYQPRGVVGVIAPWNFPLVLSVGDAIPALVAGNTVVVKPSELSPLSVQLVADLLGECGAPDDVLLVATGRGPTGAALVDEVDFVHFTGSVETGKKVAHRAIDRMTPYTLELGGNDPMIVLADADLDRAADAAVYYGMLNSGQVCMSVERVYAEAPVYDDLVERITARVRALRQGRPGGPGSADIGAMAMGEQVQRVAEHVADALRRGARAVTGGRAGEGPGHYYEPTVLVDVDHGMTALREETFGPTLPVMRVADAEEAVALANDSPYGLTASVFTRDRRRGEAIARRLEAGSVTVNDAMTHIFAFDVPMGGHKASGIGARHGPEGIRKFCREKVVIVPPFVLGRDPFWMPHGGWRTRLIQRLTRWLYGR